MHRALTANENAVLGHVVVDPIIWWGHANSADNITDPEVAIAEKVGRHQASYDTIIAEQGEDYQTRAERDALNN